MGDGVTAIEQLLVCYSVKVVDVDEEGYVYGQKYSSGWVKTDVGEDFKDI